MGCTVSHGVVAPGGSGTVAPVKPPSSQAVGVTAPAAVGATDKPPVVSVGGMTGGAPGNSGSPNDSQALPGGTRVVITPADGTTKPKKQVTPRLNFPPADQQPPAGHHTPRSTNSMMTAGSTTNATGTTASAIARDTVSPSPGITPREEDELLNDDGTDTDADTVATTAAPRKSQASHNARSSLPGGGSGSESKHSGHARGANPIVHTTHTTGNRASVPSAVSSNSNASTGASPASTVAPLAASAHTNTPPRGHRSMASHSGTVGGPTSASSELARAETPGSASMINLQLRGSGIPDSPGLESAPAAGTPGGRRDGSQRPSLVQHKLADMPNAGVSGSGTDSPTGSARRAAKRAQTVGHYGDDRKNFEAASAAARVSFPQIAGASGAPASSSAAAASSSSSSSSSSPAHGVILPHVNGASQYAVPVGSFNPYAAASAIGAVGATAPGSRPQPRRRSVPNVVIQPTLAQTGGDIDFLPADAAKAGGSGGVGGGLAIDPKSPTSLKSRLMAHRLGPLSGADSPDRAMMMGTPLVVPMPASMALHAASAPPMALSGAPLGGGVPIGGGAPINPVAAATLNAAVLSTTHAAINHPRRSPQSSHILPLHHPGVGAAPGGFPGGQPPLSPSMSAVGTTASSANTSPSSMAVPAPVVAGAAPVPATAHNPYAPLNSAHPIGSPVGGPQSVSVAPAPHIDTKSSQAPGVPISVGAGAPKRASLSQGDGSGTSSGPGSTTNSMRKSNRFITSTGVANFAAAAAGGASANTVPPSPALGSSTAAAAGLPPATPSGANSSRPTSSVGSRSLGRGRGRPVALVVDDVKVTQVVTSAAMFNAGYVSEVAADGLEAVAMAQATHYEVILMDVALPKMDGVEATRRIRKFEAEHGWPPALIFGLTATVNPVSLEKYRAAGMNACLEKGSVLKQSVKMAISLADRNGYFFINSRNQIVLNLTDVVESGAPSKVVPETTAEH